MPETLDPSERARFVKGVLWSVVLALILVGTCVFGCLVPASQRAEREAAAGQ